MLSIVAKGARWLAHASPGYILQRPHDIVFGIIAATLLIFALSGPNSFLWNCLEAGLTCALCVALWLACTFVSGWVERTVFVIPKDRASERASRQVDEMVDAALD